MNRWIVSKGQSGMKLVAFVKESLEDSLSSRHIKRALESGSCRVNGRVERFASYCVGAGDAIDFFLPQQREPIEKKILYEDQHLIVCHKPGGVESTSAALEKYLKARYQLVHRLDKETSGALILAKSNEACERLLELFKQKQVSKRYLAIVEGAPTKESGTIDFPLKKLSVYQGQAFWGVDPDGKAAVTKWQKIATIDNLTLMECRPITGRTHQIRVHLHALGYPILGDTHYCRQFASRHSRMYLHAWKLEFPHPIGGNPLSATAPVADFQPFNQVIAELL